MLPQIGIGQLIVERERHVGRIFGRAVDRARLAQPLAGRCSARIAERRHASGEGVDEALEPVEILHVAAAEQQGAMANKLPPHRGPAARVRLHHMRQRHAAAASSITSSVRLPLV
jgi:hypothetical protein